LIFYVATYVACAALPFALLHKEVNFTVNFNFLDLEFVRFRGCFFGQKKLFFWRHWIFCDIGGFFGFLMIQFWLILEKMFCFYWKFRKKFHFLDLEFVRFSAAFCCSAISFFWRHWIFGDIGTNIGFLAGFSMIQFGNDSSFHFISIFLAFDQTTSPSDNS